MECPYPLIKATLKRVNVVVDFLEGKILFDGDVGFDEYFYFVGGVEDLEVILIVIHKCDGESFRRAAVNAEIIRTHCIVKSIPDEEFDRLKSV
jgi:hypothetical protein